MSTSKPPKAPKRPKPRGIGDARLRAQKGPDEAGRWWWRAEVYEDGASRTVWRGWATEQDAVQAVAAIVARNELDKAPTGPDEARTVRDLMELWLGRQQGRGDLSPHTVTGQRIAARKVVAAIGDVKLERLDRGTLERFRDLRMREGGASSTVRQELVAISAAWRYLRELGLVPDRTLPSIRHKVEPSPKRSRVTPSRGDAVEVLAFMDGWSRVAAHLYAATGCRLGELHDLRVNQLDLDDALVIVSGKTGPRPIPLAPPAVTSLRAWLAGRLIGRPEDTILGVTSETVRTNLRELIHRAVAAANAERERRGATARIEPWSPQGFRRAAVIALYRSGVDVGIAAAVVGHSPTTALRAYRQVSEEDRRDAIRLARLGYLDAGDVVDLDAVRRRK